MIRSIAAVFVGLIVTVMLVMVLSALAGLVLGSSPVGQPTPLYLALNLIGGAIAGMCGGATAVRVAPQRPHGHVIALALVLLLLSLPWLFSAPAPGQPSWYPLVLSALGPGAVLVGGLLAARRRYDTPPRAADA